MVPNVILQLMTRKQHHMVPNVILQLNDKEITSHELETYSIQRS
jgi:hypothetical protein